MRSFVVAFAFAATSLAATAAEPTKADSAWWGHIKVLASDAYEGRLTGSPGYLRAANYVATAFKAAGLTPAGADGGYFQPVKFEVETINAARSIVSLASDQGVETLAVGPDIILSAREVQPAAVSAPLMFIGYGLHLPEVGYDDFADQDLKGKIVVVIGGGPSSLSAAMKSHASSYAFPRALQAAGAVGFIRIQNPAAMDIPWTRLMALSGQPGMRLADPALQNYHRPIFSASMNPARAELLFARSGHSFQEMLALANAHAPLPRFALGQTLTASVVSEIHGVVSPNVVGVLEGSDPALKAQYVVVSAHLDHLGVGEPIKGDRVYHGAMDNASGVASLIETARSMHAAATPPRRSIVFLAICGEEKGLLGSLAFAEHPTVPKSAIVADVNMDEFLPLFPLRHLLVLGEGESTLGALARAVAQARGLDTLPDPAPDRNIFVRSDQYSFIKTGVPSIALKFQGLPGSPEEKIEKDWNTYRYHSPQDDLTQPVDLAAADAFDAYLVDLVRRVADEDQRPRWNRDSFFRRFDLTGAASTQ